MVYDSCHRSWQPAQWKESNTQEYLLVDILGREQVQLIVERSKELEQAEQANKRLKCAFEMSRTTEIDCLTHKGC